MLAYRHAFHAGNHADVLKHTVYACVLRYLNLKDKPYRIVDTHAGAGGYELTDPAALKTGEADDGVRRLWARDDPPAPVAAYLDAVRAFNPPGALTRYPGSPEFADRLRRGRDELDLFELHPADFPVLEARFDGVPGVTVRRADGFAGLARRLPPPSRRGLVLMDPSYEGTADYARVLTVADDGLRRFAEGVWLIWYPVVLNKPDSVRLPERLKEIAADAPKGWLHARLTVRAPDADGFGMVGSGMFVINPPYTLHAELEPVLPYLAKVLAQDAAAGFRLEHRPV